MFETIGDFDVGKDRLIGDQLESVLFVIASLQIYFGLPLWSSVKFHNQMSNKSCPGTSIDRTSFIGLVKKKREELESQEVTMFSAPKAESAAVLETILSSIAAPSLAAEGAISDDGEHQHDAQLEGFMDSYNANPFLPADKIGAETVGPNELSNAQAEAGYNCQ